MIKKIWLILIVLVFQGCSEFIDAVNNFQLPEWETEMSFHIYEENVRIAERMGDSLISAYDCMDTTFCDTSFGQIYLMEITNTIDTIKVDDSMFNFENITKEFIQSIDDVDIEPINQNLSSEIGIIQLGQMAPQSTPLFTFNEIMPSDVLDAANFAIDNNQNVEIPQSTIEPVEQEFTFDNFEEAVIQSSTISISIENQMFITLGNPINIELRNIESDAIIGQVSFSNPIPTDSTATEVLNLNGATLPGTIKIVVTGSTLGTEEDTVPIQEEDLDSGFLVSITVNEMYVVSATALIPEQTIEKSGFFEMNQSSSQVQLVNALIEFGLLELNVENEIPLASELEMTIPGLTNNEIPFTATFEIDASTGGVATVTNTPDENLNNYTLSMTNNQLEYNYTVTTVQSTDFVTIESSNAVNVNLKIHGADESSGMTFTSIDGYFKEKIENSNQIELESETKLESAELNAGTMTLSIGNGLGIDADIMFSLEEFIDTTGNELTAEFEINSPNTIHEIDLSGYTIELPVGSAEENEQQYINYNSSVEIDSTILQTIHLDSSLTVSVEIAGLTFSSVSGIVGQTPIPPDTTEISIDLPKAIDEFSEQLSDLDFYKSDIEIVINSTIDVPVEIELELKSFRASDDENNNTSFDSDTAFYETTLSIDPTNEINVFNLTGAEVLLNNFPNKIEAIFSGLAGGGNTIGQISQNSEFSGMINVQIPLAFFVNDTINLDLDMSKTAPLDEKVKNIQHAEIITTVSSNLGLDFKLSAYIFADTLDEVPIDTLINALIIDGGETTENINALDSNLFAIMMEDTTYIKPVITIMGKYDEEGDPLPFVIYSTDSLHLDLTANTNVLIDSTMLNGGN